MARYHLSPKDGLPRKCSARIKCEYASENDGAGVEHYNNKADAMKAYENNMAAEYGSKKTAGLSKKKEYSGPYPQLAGGNATVEQCERVLKDELEKLSGSDVARSMKLKALLSDFPKESKLEVMEAFRSVDPLSDMVDSDYYRVSADVNVSNNDVRLSFNRRGLAAYDNNIPDIGFDSERGPVVQTTSYGYISGNKARAISSGLRFGAENAEMVANAFNHDVKTKGFSENILDESKLKPVSYHKFVQTGSLREAACTSKAEWSEIDSLPTGGQRISAVYNIGNEGDKVRFVTSDLHAEYNDVKAEFIKADSSKYNMDVYREKQNVFDADEKAVYKVGVVSVGSVEPDEAVRLADRIDSLADIAYTLPKMEKMFLMDAVKKFEEQ